MTKHFKYYLAFSYFLGIGPIRFKQLISHFGDPKKAYEADQKELEKILGEKLTERFLKFRQNFSADSILEEMFKKNIQVLTQEDNDYPEQLRQIPDPPICLYLLGNKKILNQKNLLAIVGSRKPTSYGLQIAESFAFELTQYGLIIVSGMALGIDSAAHWAAIKAKGKTIAVLGCGVDIIYPPSNKNLYQKIIENQGAIVSEFPPAHKVLKGLFIARNRIISGLCQGVMVVEGTKDSGALITASYAASQGREVFAPPSPINSPLSEAPNLLLKQGAKVVTSIFDILEEFNIKTKIKEKDKKSILEKFSGLEKEILKELLNEAKTADELAITLNQPIDKILNSLSLLEIERIIGKNQEGKFFITF